jgi:hypothetical protein
MAKLGQITQRYSKGDTNNAQISPRSSSQMALPSFELRGQHNALSFANKWKEKKTLILSDRHPSKKLWPPANAHSTEETAARPAMLARIFCG